MKTNAMSLSIAGSMIISLLAVGPAKGTPEQVPLRVGNGPVVALLQPIPNPKKPYIAQMFAPGENPVPLLADSPPDHFHHHGLMFAIGVDDTDFWTEKGIKNSGCQKVVETIVTPAGDGFTQKLLWLTTDGTPLLQEARRVMVRATGNGAELVHWLDWESTLEPAAGRETVLLSGAHYFGLGMRFVSAWANKGKFIWADPAVPPAIGGERIASGDWCAVHNSNEGRPVTVLMLAHPANPRPGEWFTMSRPFCYLAATLNLKNEPFRLVKGRTWRLRYSLAVIASAADHTRLANMAAAWKSSNPLTKTEPSTTARP